MHTNTSHSICLLLVIYAVGWSATSKAATLQVPQTFPTVQAAIDAASDGDTVEISPGVYSGPVDFRGRKIVVRGVAVSETEVQIFGGAPVVKFISGESPESILENVTVSGGSGTMGGGIQIVNSSPVIRRCRITTNTVSGDQCFGGGVFVDGGSPRIENCGIFSNSASSGRVVSDAWPDFMALGGGVYLKNCSAKLSDCRISANTCTTWAAHGWGGAANVWADGGGVCKDGSGMLTMTRCVVTTNSVSATTSRGNCFGASGGGIRIAGSATLTSCTISNNQAAGCANGGGACFAGNSTALLDTILCENSPTQFSGIYADIGANIVSATCTNPCPSDLDGNRIVDTADIGVLLLDFGTCYEPPVALAAPAPKPLLADEPAQKPVQR